MNVKKYVTDMATIILDLFADFGKIFTYGGDVMKE